MSILVFTQDTSTIYANFLSIDAFLNSVFDLGSREDINPERLDLSSAVGQSNSNRAAVVQKLFSAHKDVTHIVNHTKNPLVCAICSLFVQKKGEGKFITCECNETRKEHAW